MKSCSALRNCGIEFVYEVAEFIKSFFSNLRGIYFELPSNYGNYRVNYHLFDNYDQITVITELVATYSMTIAMSLR